MLTQDHAREAQTLLAAADCAFDDGDLREGSRLLWEASRIAIAAVARKLGRPCDTFDDIKQVIFHLDGVDEKGRFSGYPRYSAKFGVAQSFKEHAETDEWELPEFDLWQKRRKGVAKHAVPDSLHRFLGRPFGNSDQ